MHGRKYHNAKLSELMQGGVVNFDDEGEPNLVHALLVLARELAKEISKKSGKFTLPPVHESLTITMVIDRPKDPAPAEVTP